MKNLVIVESPTKARTIGKFLGTDYVIKASMGHVMDLPKSTLGVDIEHNFAPQYELMKDKKQIVAELKAAAKDAQSIILATDPDREGEAIALHVAQVLSNKKVSKAGKVSNVSKGQTFDTSRFKRIVFHEITKEAIEEAFKNPRSIDVCLVDAQTARRVLDRLVGYKLSPILWQKVRRGLSAGRVQSIALRLIVEREREIEKFSKENYYTINVILSEVKDLKSEEKEMPKQVRHDKNEWTEFELIEINGEKIEIQKTFDLYDGEYKVTKTNIENEEKAKKISDDLNTKEFVVSDVLKKEIHRSPAPPYTTSTLQQDSNRRLGFPGKKTMRVAQKLYEEGFITYHRTDSVILSNSAVFAMRGFIEREYGKNYIPKKPRFYQTKQKLAQEAHEAIRPTNVGELQAQSSKLKAQIGGDASRLYELIWRRAVASQMSDAVIESTTVYVDSQIQNEGNVYKFKTNGSVLVFEGFLKLNPQAIGDKRLPEFRAKEELDLIDLSSEKHETLPPPRYNDASIIKTLEEKGIGRPSTYAAIISTIEDRNYVERVDRKFVPTPIGIAVNNFLVKNFSTIDDIPFTAEMENQLDEIAKGEKKWVNAMKEFYIPFEKKLQEVKTADRVQIAVEETSQKCDKCGASLVIRHGRFGKFLSCSKFPQCKFSKPLNEETNLLCKKCAGKIIIRRTKKGKKFYGCSNYPKCDFASWILPQQKNGKS